jgi:hypothetical protein
MTGKDRLTFQTLANKRNRIARSNAKLAHEHLVMLGDVFGLKVGRS